MRPMRQLPAWIKTIFVLSLLLGLIRAYRHPLLRAMGEYLITEDAVLHADAVLVPGGSSADRGAEAARLWQQGRADRFVFTGAPVPGALRSLGIDSTEAQCTRNSAVAAGIPMDRTVALAAGTSTWEEAEALLPWCMAAGADTVIIVSNRFHLRRLGMVYRKRFKQAGITVLLHGARASDFDERTWWRSEEGLIMLNNEYVKLLWYRLEQGSAPSGK
jgi:uncharacterized SAM-binding protein YcdF (DUF218 family)